MTGHPDAAVIVAGGFSRAIRPPKPVPLSKWMAENIVLVDGPHAGELWSLANAPYLEEIADCLCDDHPCNLVTVRKSQQTGASILALGWCLYIADREPANTLYVAPGIDMLRDLNSAKLQPLIRAWHKHIKRTVIAEQTSRSGAGSTTYEKVFPGGRLWLGNANSVMDLSSKTAKKGIKDELSKWQDIPGFGDPETLFEGRFTAFRRLKSYKILEISTPEIDTGDELGEAAGHCRIDRSFKRSDQRFYFLPCPECGAFFTHNPDRFQVDEARPHRSVYLCDHCGHGITETERVAALKSGLCHWRPTAPGPDRHPGFHIDAFISLMMSYEAIAEDKIKAEKRGEKGRKDFTNLTLGRPFRFRGDAPDYEKLMARRDPEVRRGRVPAGGLLLVAAADVQMRGIWLEIIAVGADRQTWTVDVDYLDGDTSHPMGEAFQRLRAATIDRTFRDAWDRPRRLDALAVDAGYRSHVVYAWVRNNQRLHPDTGRDLILAVDGRDGWGHPAIGTPKLVDIDLDGHRVKQGAKLWPVGTWPLKGSFYADLQLQGVMSGQPANPPGYCHFGAWLDEAYFKQLTDERLEDVIVRGRVAGRRWVDTGNNHLLDCRVYNMALAEYLGLSTMTPQDWAALARARGLPDELSKFDLFTARSASPEPAEVVRPPETATPGTPSEPEGDGWIKPNKDWMKR
ncbi:phage terminase large subunit family protein [Chelatococcus composti]|nr:phage terminase large subunit family protein [Chelatococcus composti]GGG48029.1 hypothetical protein GCM10008026_31600 [Chelatococcus composti]